MRGRRNRRRAFALSTLVLWLLAVEVLPSLHLAAHADDHSHTTHGTIVIRKNLSPERAAALAHALAHANGLEHDHGARPKKPRKHSTETIVDDAAHDHAASGITHRATALLDPPPPLTMPLAVPLARAWRHAEPDNDVVSTLLARASARGPPAA